MALMRACFAVALLLAGFASLVPAAAANAAEPATPAKPADDRLRTVILGVQGRRGVDDKQLAAALTDVVQGIYAGDTRRIVIGRDDIMRVLDLEAEKQSLGCDSDKCLAEVGQALDAARIVTGSLDKLGDGYMVTMTEIDARSLEAIGRVQERVPIDENKLVDAVTRLAGELVKQASTMAAGSTVRGFASAGSLEIETDPRGAKIVLAGNELGQSPTKIDNLAAGTQRLRLVRDDYEPVEVDVPIYSGGTTKVTAEMRILRALAEQNLQVRQEKWRETNQWHTAGAWTKVGLGTLVAGAGTLYGAGNLGVTGGERNLGQAVVGFALIGGAGAGILSWGILDLLTPPPPPVPEWEIERKVVVTPPKEQAPQKVQVLQEGKAPGMANGTSSER
jgi:hypothetical protein